MPRGKGVGGNLKVGKDPSSHNRKSRCGRVKERRGAPSHEKGSPRTHAGSVGRGRKSRRHSDKRAANEDRNSVKNKTSKSAPAAPKSRRMKKRDGTVTAWITCGAKAKKRTFAILRPGRPSAGPEKGWVRRSLKSRRPDAKRESVYWRIGEGFPAKNEVLVADPPGLQGAFSRELRKRSFEETGERSQKGRKYRTRNENRETSLTHSRKVTKLAVKKLGTPRGKTAEGI